MRIVFMGTPDFAVGVLDNLIKKQYNIVGVVTAVDKPAGRGKKLHQSSVKQYALKHQLNLLQPQNLKDIVFIEHLKKLKADIFIVVAFRMLPKAVWQIPNQGTFNLHASLLPAYRGAAPINWAIINGDDTTGVTTFFIDDKIDTGAIIKQKTLPITEKETAGTLHDKLLELGQNLVVETLEAIKSNTVKLIEQSDNKASQAPKLTKLNTKIDWSLEGKSIEQFVRGLNPYPVAWTNLRFNDKEVKVKIYDVDFLEGNHQINIGEIVVEHKTLKVAVNNGWIYVKIMQMPGKKAMEVSSLLNGYTFKKEDFFV